MKVAGSVMSVGASSEPWRWVTLGVLATSAVGFAAVVFSTRWGAGITPDSVSYVVAARNVLAGNGLVLSDGELLSLQPPLLPVILAGSGTAGASVLDSARWLNAILYPVNIVLLGLGIALSTRRRFALALFGSLLLASSASILRIHSMIWSEPLFLACAFGSMLLQSRYLERRETSCLVLGALLAGAALGTRYVGVTVIATGTLAVLLLGGSTLKRRLVASVTFCGVASVVSVPIVGMILETGWGRPGNRKVVYHPPTGEQLMEGYETLTSWLLPSVRHLGSWREWSDPVLATFIVAFIAGLVRWFRRRGREERLPPLLSVSAIFAGTYSAFLLVSVTFIDAHIPLDPRILSPLYGVGVVWTLFLIDRVVLRGNRALEVVACVLAVCFVADQAAEAARWSVNAGGPSSEMGFTGARWKQSPTLAAVRGLPVDDCLYSNGFDALVILADRDVVELPQSVHPPTRRENENLGADLATLRQDMLDRGCALVYLRLITDRWYLPGEEHLVGELGLRPESELADGTIYRAVRSP